MAAATPHRPNLDREQVERRSTYLALIGLSLFAAFSTRLMRGRGEVRALGGAVARRRVGAERATR